MQTHQPTPDAAGLREQGPGSAPTLPSGTPRLFVLTRVLRSLALLHQSRVHGAVHPHALSLEDGNLWLNVPPEPDHTFNLKARLLHGDLEPIDVAHFAPEVVAGATPTRASDVYSAAALVVHAVTGAPPAGQLELGKLFSRPAPALERTLREALHPDPDRRPTAQALAAALAGFADAHRAAPRPAPAAQDIEHNLPRPRFGVDAADDAAAAPAFATPRYAPSQERKSQVSTLLAAVLFVGGASVLIGALWLAVKAWEVFPDVGRLFLLGGLTGAVGLAGRALTQTDWTRSARTLILLFTQLFWAVAAYGLTALHIDWPWAWVGAALAVTGITTAVAWRRRDVELWLAVAVNGLVALNNTWFALDEEGRLYLLIALAFAVLGAGKIADHVGQTSLGRLLTTVFTQSFWIVLIYWGGELHASEGAIVAGSALIFLLTYSLGVWGARLELGIAAAFDLMCVIFLFGAWKSTGSDEGFLILTGLGAGLYALMTVIGHVLSSRAIGVPHAVGGIAFAVFSGVAGLWLFADHGRDNLWCLYPYALWGVPTALALLAHRAGVSDRARTYVSVTLSLGAALLLVPTIEALIAYDIWLFQIVPVAVGAVLIGLAFIAWDDDGQREIALTLFGVGNAITAPVLLVLVRCLDKPFDRHPEVLLFCLAVAAGLCAAAVRFSLKAQRKVSYRVVEFCGAGVWMGLLTWLSWARLDDWGYPTLLFGGGAVLLFMGLLLERAASASVAAIGLIINLVMQYFGKLHEHVPTSMLLIGFGVALLVAGLAYEKQVKPLLPRLKTWT